LLIGRPGSTHVLKAALVMNGIVDSGISVINVDPKDRQSAAGSSLD
jgi:hypothetical protein